MLFFSYLVFVFIFCLCSNLYSYLYFYLYCYFILFCFSFYFSLSFYWALGPLLFWGLFWAQVSSQSLKPKAGQADQVQHTERPKPSPFLLWPSCWSATRSLFSRQPRRTKELQLSFFLSIMPSRLLHLVHDVFPALSHAQTQPSCHAPDATLVCSLSQGLPSISFLHPAKTSGQAALTCCLQAPSTHHASAHICTNLHCPVRPRLQTTPQLASSLTTGS